MLLHLVHVQLLRQKLSKKSVKAYARIPKGSLEIPNKFQSKLRIHNALTVQRRLEMAGNMDSEL